MFSDVIFVLALQIICLKKYSIIHLRINCLMLEDVIGFRSITLRVGISRSCTLSVFFLIKEEIVQRKEIIGVQSQ